MENKKTLYPITEDFLKQYSINCPPLIPLYRNYDVQKEYDKYRSSNNFFIFIDNMKELLKNETSILRLNDYPYYTEDNIKHYVLWFNNIYVKNNTNDNSYFNNFIKQELDKYFTKNENIKKDKNGEFPIIENIITYWINIPKNMSIKDILHIHIFTKPVKTLKN